MMIEKVLVFNDWQEAAAKLQPPHPEAGIIAQRMAFEATTRNLSKVTFIEKPAVQVVGNTARKISPQRQAEIDALEKLRIERAKLNGTAPIVRSARFDTTELVNSDQLEVGQVFSIAGQRATFQMKHTTVDGKPHLDAGWVVTGKEQQTFTVQRVLKTDDGKVTRIIAKGISFHVGNIKTVIRIKPDAEAVEVATTPEPPKPSLLQALEIMVNGPSVQAIIPLPTILASIGKPITALTQEDFKAGNLPTLDEAITAWNSGQITTPQYKSIRNAIGLHDDPEMFLAVEALVNETA